MNTLKEQSESFDTEDTDSYAMGEEIVENYAVDLSNSKVTKSQLKKDLEDGMTLMEILEYGLTAEDIEDPELKAKWDMMMDVYVQLGSFLDEVEDQILK